MSNPKVIIDSYNISIAGINYKDVVVNTELLSELTTCIPQTDSHDIIFSKCIFPNGLDINLHEFDGNLVFTDCKFYDELIIFGDFNCVVSISGSTFNNASVSFQDCTFNHFVMCRCVFSDSVISFQETNFLSSHVILNNNRLLGSKLLFQNNAFSKDADLLDLLCTKADEASSVIFQMVDLMFREVRLFHSNIVWLEFRDCTFECGRFDFDCNCENLILQDCSNFRILTFDKLKGLKHLNILGFRNLGKIRFNQSIHYFISAIECKRAIVWAKGLEYRLPAADDYANQLYTFIDFLDRRQSKYESFLVTEAEALLSGRNVNFNQKVFLSYASADTELVDKIDDALIKRSLHLTRYTRDIDYTQSISAFMRTIRLYDFVLLVVTESFLKSRNCLFEVNELIKDDNFRERILPIISTNAQIFTPEGRNDYYRYWQKQLMQLHTEVKTLDVKNLEDTIEAIKQVDSIVSNLPEFLKSIADLKAIITDSIIKESDINLIIERVKKADSGEFIPLFYPNSTQSIVTIKGDYIRGSKIGKIEGDYLPGDN